LLFGDKVVGTVALTRAAEAARRKTLNCILARVYRKQRFRGGKMTKLKLLKEGRRSAQICNERL